TRSGVLWATIAPVTFCSSSPPVYGVKSRLMVTFGATCLYCSTSVCSVPPWVPGSVPFMPCQKVIVTGAALVWATAVAAPETAVAATGATAVASADTVGAADATAGATAVAAAEIVGAAAVAAAETVGATAVAAAAEVGATAVAVALTLVAAGATCVGAFGGALVHATATKPIRIGSRSRMRMIECLLSLSVRCGRCSPENGAGPG